jgi:hypothetical protein
MTWCRAAHTVVAAVAAGAVVLVPAAVATQQAKVKVPRSGKYTGKPGKLTIYTSGKSIDLVSFQFKCRNTTGTTSLNSIPLKKSKRGYRFAIKAHGSVEYADQGAPENGAVQISGRFSPAGSSAKGILKVKTRRCGSTGDINWRAAR